MPSSPLVEETNVFSFSILSEGKEIPSTYEVMGINITHEINKIAQAEITLRDGSSPSQSFDIIDADIFKPGAEIEIKLGYQSKNDSIFKGLVVKQSIRVDEGSVSRLQITCKDKADSLTRSKKNATFQNIKDSALIEQLVGSVSGLSSDVTATSVEHKEIVQSDSSDWDFINIRASINGMVVETSVDKVTVAIPEVSDTPELQIQFGYDMIDFDTEVDATNQFAGVECSAWDVATQAMIKATAKEPSTNQQGDITGETLSDVLSLGTKKLTTSGSMTQDELQAWADSELLRLRLSRFMGSVTFHGSSKAKINSTIKLLGLSDRFNGNAYITGITHTVDNGRWHTNAKIGLSPDSFAEENTVSSPSASGLVPGIRGLQTGIVKKINEDPDNEFRVQVEMPLLGDDSEPIWARLSTFYAGNTIGAYFMPEVDDEVILGFMNDDPRFPIILGSVFSSKIPAPETPDEKNTIKTLITQSKLQLKFDDENKVITILTPGGNTMVFSDKDKGITVTDQNSNKIEMTDNGISLTDKSSNKIEMSSSGITIDSKSNLTLKAAQEVSVKGLSVAVSGDQSATVKGSAECEVSSSGQMSVKGAMVAIN